MSNETQQPKDASFDYKSIKNVTLGEGSKGEPRIQISFTKEAIPALLDAIAALQDNERGVKLDLHVYAKEKDGRTFNSAKMFVKAIQEFGAGGGAAKPAFRSAFPKTASPATTSTVAAARAAVTNGASKRLA